MVRGLVFGVAAVLVVALAAVGAMALRRALDDSAEGAVTQGGTSPGQAFELARPAVVPGGLELTVISVDFDAWPELLEAVPDTVPPGENVRMVSARIRAVNVGSKPVRVTAADFGVQGSGHAYYGAGGGGTACGDVPGLLEAELQPGQRADGSICVRVPADETDLLLVWSVGGVESEPRYFVLGDPDAPPTAYGGTLPIRPGITVLVQNTEGCLNVRTQPSLNAEIVRCLEDGAEATVAGGPEDAEGYRWWNLSGLGWAAEPWLAPAQTQSR